MAWIFLLIAAFFEVCWASSLKSTEGFTRLWPSVFTLSTMAVSLVFLALSVRTIPLGTGYAIWTGIGTIGTSIVGFLLFSEPLVASRLLFLALILTGILGLKFSGE